MHDTRENRSDPQPLTSLAALGPEIARRRKALGMSQDDLADAAGISRRSVYAIEHGKPTAQFDMVLNICRQLGLDLKVYPR